MGWIEHGERHDVTGTNVPGALCAGAIPRLHARVPASGRLRLPRVQTVVHGSPHCDGKVAPLSSGMSFNTKRFALLLLGTAFFAFLSTGCNTSKGFGKDVEKLGDKIEKKAS
jgi:predicted small secreted protein